MPFQNTVNKLMIFIYLVKNLSPAFKYYFCHLVQFAQIIKDNFKMEKENKKRNKKFRNWFDIFHRD